MRASVGTATPPPPTKPHSRSPSFSSPWEAIPTCPATNAKASTTLTTSNLTGSACGLSTGPFASKPFASRTLVPRLDIDGFIKLPNYPYVLGLDANLAQYSVFNRSDIDYLSKPGNDIRIYVGFKLDIGTIVSKLGLGSQ